MYRKLEMYKFEVVQTGDVQNLKIYNHVLPDVQPRATECKKKSLSKPINTGFSFEDLDARSSKLKTVRNLYQQFSKYFILKFRFCKKGKNEA